MGRSQPFCTRARIAQIEIPELQSPSTRRCQVPGWDCLHNIAFRYTRSLV